MTLGENVVKLSLKKFFIKIFFHFIKEKSNSHFLGCTLKICTTQVFMEMYLYDKSMKVLHLSITPTVPFPFLVNKTQILHIFGCVPSL